MQRAQKRRRLLRRGLSLLGLLAAVVLIVVLVGSNGGNKHHASGTTSTTSSTSSTTTSTQAPPTTTALQSSPVAPSCPSAHETKRLVWFTKAPPNCIPKQAVYLATFKTSVGDFTVRMPAASSYAAVNNFVFLARWNFYNGTFFHRIIPGFVIQGGDPTGTGYGGPHHFPGYEFTGNYPPASCKTKAGAACYQPGDFVMANSNSNPQTQNASTDGSQFFVVLPGGQTQLNTEPTYTIFGKVQSGMSVVEQIGKDGSSQGTPTTKIYLDSVTVQQLTPKA
jgi:cyclophilin family peptidyl-prolyl cis-trans isomerase